jgi:hypothetical protein
MHTDVGSGLVPQVPHELDQFAVDDSRVGPLPIERRGGGDVLRDPLMNIANGSMSLPRQSSAHSSSLRRPRMTASWVAMSRGPFGVQRLIPVEEECVRVLGYAIEGQQLDQHHLAHSNTSY